MPLIFRRRKSEFLSLAQYFKFPLRQLFKKYIRSGAIKGRLSVIVFVLELCPLIFRKEKQFLRFLLNSSSSAYMAFTNNLKFIKHFFTSYFQRQRCGSILFFFKSSPRQCVVNTTVYYQVCQ
jgi:hypothetical protein